MIRRLRCWWLQVKIEFLLAQQATALALLEDHAARAAMLERRIGKLRRQVLTIADPQTLLTEEVK